MHYDFFEILSLNILKSNLKESHNHKHSETLFSVLS